VILNEPGLPWRLDPLAVRCKSTTEKVEASETAVVKALLDKIAAGRPRGTSTRPPSSRSRKLSGLG
jgi:hypothetical protein